MIIFILQILSLLFYFEIFELNFLGLNKNTIKNIQNRERKDETRTISISSEIDFGEYIIEYDEKAFIDGENEDNNGINMVDKELKAINDS